MTRVQLFNFDDLYFNQLKKEAFRRYGTTYGSIQKLLYELIDFGMAQSNVKPSFEDLQNKPSFPGAPKNKKIGVIDMKYINIVKWFIDNNADPRSHPAALDKKISKTWKSPHTYKNHKKRILGMYDDWTYQMTKDVIE